MKKLFLSVVLTTAVALLGYAQEKYAEIKFTKLEHDYGTVEKGANGICEFEFTNTGTAPLTIQNATSTCGCTTPNKPEAPIDPGKTGVITVKYDTDTRVGEIKKTITVTSNAKNQPKVELHIKGWVKEPPVAEKK
jgi:hypothetical protein